MSTLVIHQPTSRASLNPPPDTPSLSLDTSRPSSTPIPNKHLPYCPAGPAPGTSQLASPPASPPTKDSCLSVFSVLHPATNYTQITDNPPVFCIDIFTLAAAINEQAAQPFPDPKLAFPWLHGLHSENQVQLAFFIARRKALRKTPQCFRGITIVKVGGDLTKARLKGAISPDEILDTKNNKSASFLEVDPKDGFSVRNFQIQATKMATVSDIVLYADAGTKAEEIHELAKKFAAAQNTWRVKNRNGDEHLSIFNTFIMSSRSRSVIVSSESLTLSSGSFEEIEHNHPDLVAVDSQGLATGRVMDFCEYEIRRIRQCIDHW